MFIIKRIGSQGKYKYAYVDGHPNSDARGRVLLHRALMELYLNRYLDKEEFIHHKNHNKKDNRISNLEILTNSEHSKLHSKYTKRNIVKLKCPNCGILFEREKRQTHLGKKNRKQPTCCSRYCSGKYSAKNNRD